MSWKGYERFLSKLKVTDEKKKQMIFTRKEKVQRNNERVLNYLALLDAEKDKKGEMYSNRALIKADKKLNPNNRTILSCREKQILKNKKRREAWKKAS